MPKEWTAKDERQYEHVRKHALSRGRSSERAKEIASRVVNKRRRQEGRTRNETTMGTGNPNERLENRTVAELRNRAAELNIKGGSAMRKNELIQRIRERS